jgi:hypothetical protein
VHLREVYGNGLFCPPLRPPACGIFSNSPVLVAVRYLLMPSYEPHIMVTHLFWAEENTTKTSRAESLENRVSRTIESRKRKKKRYWGQ